MFDRRTPRFDVGRGRAELRVDRRCPHRSNVVEAGISDQRRDAVRDLGELRRGRHPNLRHGWQADIDDTCGSKIRTLSGAAVANLHSCAAILVFVGLVYSGRLEIKWQEPS